MEAMKQDTPGEDKDERAHPDLNQGPADLQSAALTTELCTHGSGMGIWLPVAISSLHSPMDFSADQRDIHNHMKMIHVGSAPLARLNHQSPH